MEMFYAATVVFLMTLARADSVSFLSDELDFNILIGGNVTLPCEIDSPAGVMIAWRNDAGMISFNRDILSDEHEGRSSIEGEGGVYNLVINNLALADEGPYECEIAGKGLTQKHEVTVNIPPSIEVSPDQEVIDAKLGEILALSCQASGKPTPTVTWRRDGAGLLLPNGQETYEGERLEFPPMDKDNADIYTCRADNSQGSPVTKVFEVFVRYPPSVDAGEAAIHTGLGDDVSIECVFDASPSVQVVWSHNGSDINNLERPNVQQRNGDQTWTLQITDVQMIDMGSYVCQGGNDYGGVAAQTILSGTPEKLAVTSVPYGEYSNEYTLEWEVLSYSPPIEYFLKFKQANESMQTEWQLSTIPSSTEPAGSDMRTQQYKFLELTASGSYMVKLQARNVFGLSNWTEEFEFFTAEEGKTAPPTTTPKPTTERATDKPVVPDNGGSVTPVEITEGAKWTTVRVWDTSPAGDDSGSGGPSHLTYDLIHLVAMVSMMTLTLLLA